MYQKVAGYYNRVALHRAHSGEVFAPKSGAPGHRDEAPSDQGDNE